MATLSGDPMATVFLSCSREDQPIARQLVAALESSGCSVWWDGLLSVGERFSRTTAAELAKADAVVVIWSKISIESHWVHDEATDGRDCGRLVPVSIDGDADGALSHLELAFKQGDVGVVELATDPLMDPIRKDARWPAFEQRIGYRR
jgi:TIR domain